jgi:hypothetical protein
MHVIESGVLVALARLQHSWTVSLDLHLPDCRITLASDGRVRRRVANMHAVDKSGGLYSHTTDCPPSRCPTTGLETDCLLSA